MYPYQRYLNTLENLGITFSFPLLYVAKGSDHPAKIYLINNLFPGRQPIVISRA